MPIKCTEGKPCGNTCISKKDTCNLDAHTAKVLDKLVAGSNAPRVSAANIQDKVIAEIDAAPTEEEKRRAAKALLSRLDVDTLRDIEANIGAFASSEAAKGEYQLPGMKRRTVSDAQVDAAWDNLTSEQRKLLFSPNAGAPDRGEADLRETEWGKDTDRMRRSMLKAMMEQSDDEGNILDPWTGKPLTFPADLDHIVPVSKGGGHGGRQQGVANAGYESENWVWVHPIINRTYKRNDDVFDTYALMKKHIDEGDEGYQKAVDDVVTRLTGSVKATKELAKRVEQGIRAHFGLPTNESIQPQLPRPDEIPAFNAKEQKALLKSADEAGLIPNRANVRDLPADKLKELNQEIFTAVQEEVEVAAAVIRATQAAQRIGNSDTPSRSTKIPTNKAIKDIMSKRGSIEEMTDHEMQRCFERLRAGKPDELMRKDVKAALDKALKVAPLPFRRRSVSPWAYAHMDKKVPDLKSDKITARERKLIYDYMQRQFDL